MVRSSKPNLVTGLLLLVLFVGGLVTVHLTVGSLIGREVADVSVLVLFFVGAFLWGVKG